MFNTHKLGPNVSVNFTLSRGKCNVIKSQYCGLHKKNNAHKYCKGEHTLSPTCSFRHKLYAYVPTYIVNSYHFHRFILKR